MTGHSDTSGVQAKAFTISRTFQAPRALVWQAFAEGERLAQWWGPTGFSITVFRFEFRPGGIFHYRMDGPNGFTMWGRYDYREIVEPDRIVFVNAFSDEAGTIARGPFFDGVWPLEILTTVTFDEQDGKTEVTLRSYPIDASEAEQAAFESNRESMKQGFGGTFDQLREFLAREQASA